MWEKIEVLLVERKMTKYELAKKAGLNQNSLIDLKKGRKKSLKFDDVVKIADVLEVSLDEFRKGWEYAMDTWSVEGSRWVNSKRISRGIRRFFTDDCKTRER